VNDAEKVLSGRMVDLDIFAPGITEYVLTDIAGAQHKLQIPDDVPFPLPLQLAARYDELVEAVDAKGADREAAMARAWEALLEVLQRLVRLTQDGEAADAWQPERFGQGVILALVNALNLRWQFHVAGGTMRAFIEQLLAPAVEGKGGPKVPSSSEPPSAV
jgi:hypothetical protein